MWFSQFVHFVIFSPCFSKLIFFFLHFLFISICFGFLCPRVCVCVFIFLMLVVCISVTHTSCVITPQYSSSVYL